MGCRPVGRRIGHVVRALVAVCCACALNARAGSNDNESIPDDVLSQELPTQEKREKAAGTSFFLEDTVSRNHWRSPAALLLPGRGAKRPDWSNLLQFGMRSESKLGSSAKITLDALALAESAEGTAFKARRDTHLFLREAYASIPPGDGQYLDIGRINLRSGVATGFNPTDYFKTNALIRRTTEDPSQLRNNRLGTVVLRWQALSEDAAWSFVYAPEIGRKSPPWTTDASTIGQEMQRTNERERGLVKYSRTFANNTAADVSAYSESGRPQLGLNLSQGVGNKTLLTLETNWARRRTLMNEMIATSEAPVSAAILNRFGRGGDHRTLNQTSVGGSYTSDNNVTTLLEFHYNEAGLSKRQWHDYFDAARAGPNPSTQLQLLSVRHLASVRLEPLSRKTLFLRVSAPEIFHPDLTLTLLTQRDLEDRSKMFQLEAAWLLSKQASARLRYASFLGDSDSNYGSNSLRSSVLLQLNYAL